MHALSPAAPRTRAHEHACAALPFAFGCSAGLYSMFSPSTQCFDSVAGWSEMVPVPARTRRHRITKEEKAISRCEISGTDILMLRWVLCGAVRCLCMRVVRRQPDTWAHMRVHSHACTCAQVLLLREHMLSFPHEHVQCKSLHRPDQPISQFKSISDQSEYRTPHELIVGAEL